jgi:hypothetical protein
MDHQDHKGCRVPLAHQGSVEIKAMKGIQGLLDQMDH